MFGLIYFLIFFGSFLCAAALTGLVLKILKRRQIIDMPNNRSNHSLPTPRGGGIAVISVILVAWLGVGFFLNKDIADIWPVFLGIVILALVSLIDDVKNLRIYWRLAVQIIAVALGIKVLLVNAGISLTGYLPLWLEAGIIGVIWIWFINLYNFMDGIDGIASAESVAIAAGICLIVIIRGLPYEMLVYASVIAAACLGFLLWNWHPAKLFIGDVGSIPLGFILGWLLFEMALRGYWAEALIIPGYYIADSTFTIIKRLVQGKKIWEAHSEHFYQQAVRSGKKHSVIVGLLILLNIILVVMAYMAAVTGQKLAMLISGYILVATVQYYFFNLYRKSGR